MSIISKLKREILIAVNNSGEGHIPSAFSVLDIIWVLYDKILTVDPVKPDDDQRDRFIMSKGHASIALYAVLSEKGFFDKIELNNFTKYDGILGGHPDHTKVPGVEASTGSLGHGFPMAVGMSLGMRIKENSRNVFILVGDQECNEGTIWECALLAAHYNLKNLCLIIDNNHSTDRYLSLGDIDLKFKAFGWESSVIDGHNHDDIYHSLINIKCKYPRVIIANTVKGYGIREMENNPAWHHRSPTDIELSKFLNELG